jgi:tRNA 2-selenouridine synthase
VNSPAPIIKAREFCDQSQILPVMDVRSPGEYESGHIPGAVNVPLFSDDERAKVGTTYSNAGHDAAVFQGLEIVGPKMASLAQSAKRLAAGTKANSNKILVHCWRGGMRSQSMAWLTGVAALQPSVLEGGYKSFRRLAQQTIQQPWRLMVVSGLTGAGKTRILSALKDAGEQVCDLERLANHRGSAYGGIAQGDQPTTEQFENDLFHCLDQFCPDRRIWVEDEGNRIGRVVVPQDFYEQVRHAPAVFMDVSLRARVDNLMVDYQQLPVEGLIRATEKIRKRLGNRETDETISAIERGDLAAAVETTLSYYDRTYLKAAKKMPRDHMQTLATENLSDDQIVDQCIRMAEQINIDPESRLTHSRV